VEIRLIAATNRNLEDLVQAGKFREDLFYRINVVRVQLPSLRERREDIPLLVEHFLKSFGENDGKKIKISPKAMELLVRYDWPGNIRELANEIQKCCALSPKVISPELLSDPFRRATLSSARLGSLDANLKNTEKALILEALETSHFSKVKAAKILGISRITLYKKMKAYKIKLKEAESN
jgi:transcriptional regulator with PAS, ATPase and Fis domain